MPERKMENGQRVIFHGAHRSPLVVAVLAIGTQVFCQLSGPVQRVQDRLKFTHPFGKALFLSLADRSLHELPSLLQLIVYAPTKVITINRRES